MPGRYFLWGGTRAAPNVRRFTPKASVWWQQFVNQSNYSEAAIAELRRTSHEINALIPDPVAWKGAPRPFRGLVVGAVQSGKTSSMIGVSAIALDQGFKLLVVLAGGKDDLRQQTARRFNVQLVRQRDDIPGLPGGITVPLNAPDRPNGGMALPYSVDVHQWAPGFIRVRQTLRRGEPCVFVIKKNLASLAVMRQFLRRAYDEFGPDNLPTLVLDDECDDASVDQAGAPIPDAIANLWRTSDLPPIAYVGYTATAAANLLQSPQNELYPEHFVYLLRYPGSEPSALSTYEPEPTNWYSGSQCFYSDFGFSPGPDDNFLIEDSVRSLDVVHRDDESLRDALRAYLVSGAYRLALQPDATFDDFENLPPPHSMLVQTSASMDEHEQTFNLLISMFGGERRPDGTGQLSASGVESDVLANEQSWSCWYQSFYQSRERIYIERPSARPASFASWDQVKKKLGIVAHRVVLKAVNSDPQTGQDLDYSPRMTAAGPAAPQDLYVIVVGGAKLSRGITLEGLCISYFTRWVTSPNDDTVMQISRWFGYRGKHLEFCRLFTSVEIYEALQEIHENDRDLRLQLADLMAQRKTPREAGLVLNCNPRSLPTSKVGAGRVHDIAFSPFQSVFKTVEVQDLDHANQEAALSFVRDIRSRNSERVETASGTHRGELSRGWTVEEVACALESLRFTGHNPSLLGNPGQGYHKPPDNDRPVASILPLRSDPYQVASYLREWAQLFAEGKASTPPLFDVGVAYGQMTDGDALFDFPLLDRLISPNGRLLGDWTGRSASWRGDALFDNPDQSRLLEGSASRGVGLRGLLLLYVIHRDARGRAGEGVARRKHTPAFGISIPAGGPKLRRVTVIPSRP
jgi:hypothetical protein